MILIKNALANLKSHKLRLFITIFWIIIGITSVVVVSSIGTGLKATVQQSIQNIDENSATIYFEVHEKNMENYSSFLKPFTKEDLTQISLLEGVKSVKSSNDNFSMESIYYTSATFDNNTSSISMTPFDFNKDKLPSDIYCGRSIGLDDDFRKVIVISMNSANELFSSAEDAIGRGINIDNEIYEVIGVLSEVNLSNKERLMNAPDIYTSFVSKEMFSRLSNKSNMASGEIYNIKITASSGYNIQEVSDKAINKLYELHTFSEGSYVLQNLGANDNLNVITNSINTFVSVITGISLFVGGIGIMNIMYVCVIERKREIGIRRALGAKPRTILFQFLVESVFITFIGGFLGSFIGLFATTYVSTYLPFKAIPTFSGFLSAILTSILTGVVFGLVPAYKASKVDPIKAIAGS